MAARKLSEKVEEIMGGTEVEVNQEPEASSGPEWADPIIPPTEKVRLRLYGDINGYPAQIYFYDSDFFSSEPVEELLPPIGFAQYAVKIMQEHGIVPRSNSNQNGNATNSGVPPMQNQQGWTCRVHGAQRLQDNQFARGKKICGMWSPTPTEWTKPKASIVQGVTRYYCKYYEPTNQ